MNPSESKQKRGAAAMCRGCTVGRHLLRRSGNAYQREPTKGGSVRIASAVSTPGCKKLRVPTVGPVDLDPPPTIGSGEAVCRETNLRPSSRRRGWPPCDDCRRERRETRILRAQAVTCRLVDPARCNSAKSRGLSGGLPKHSVTHVGRFERGILARASWLLGWGRQRALRTFVARLAPQFPSTSVHSRLAGPAADGIS